MSLIHQILCTHCTHGSSALERREGQLAHRMLGYSARAGSLDGQELRKFYRQIERYVYYYLPRDTPGEEKLRLVASTAPRRLVYLPSSGGLQVAAQVCYRPTDTEGRPGSYFAHVVFQDETGPGRWSPADCLKLWAAPGWIEEDATSLPFLLPSLVSLNELIGKRRPAIDDRVLLSFFSTPPDGPFDDPAGVIPARWRAMTPRERVERLAETMRGMLELDAAKRETLILVAEPSAAALIFYAIARLLPPGPLRDGMSFSTFEPNTDRLCTTLAATCFHEPARADIKPDLYRGRGFALNTFLGRHTEFRRPQAPYVATVVRKLLEEGWDSVHRMLGHVEAVGAQTPEDLDSLASMDRLVPVLFDPRQPLPPDEWRRSPMAIQYLRRLLGRRMAELADPRALGSLVGRPAHLLVLELIAGNPDGADTRAAAEYLLHSLPPEQIGGLLRIEAISTEDKADALARYVAGHGVLPPGCDELWVQQRAVAAGQAPAVEPILPRLLARLDQPSLERLYRCLAEEHSDLFLVALLDICRQRKSLALVTQIVKAMPHEAVLSLYHSQGAAFFKKYPDGEPALGIKLREIVRSMPDHFGQFRERLDAVTAGADLLPTDDDQTIAAAWATCRNAILDVAKALEQRSGFVRQSPWEQAEAPLRRLVEALARALPRESFQDDARGSRKRKCIDEITLQVLGPKPLLPIGPWQSAALWQKVAWFFEQGRWSPAPLWKMQPKKRLLVQGLIVGGVALTLFLLLSALIAALHPATPRRMAPVSQLLTRPEQPGKASDNGTKKAGEESDVDRRVRELLPSGRPAEQHTAQALPAAASPAPAPAPRETARPDTAAPQVEPRPAPAESPKPVTLPVAAGHPDMAPGPPPPAVPPEIEEPASVRLEDLPMTGGRAPIARDRVPGRTGWYLGYGKLYLDVGTFAFGDSYTHEPPATRQELPALAAELKIASVYVELRPAASGLELIVSGEAGADTDALPSLRRRCETVSAVLFRSEQGGGVAAGGVAADQAPTLPTARPRPPAETPAPAAEPAGTAERPTPEAPPAPETEKPAGPLRPQAKEIAGRFVVDRKPIAGLKNPTVARIRLAVTAEGGKPLAPRLREMCLIGGCVAEQNTEGRMRLIDVADVDVDHTKDLLRGAATARVQIRFYRRPEGALPADAEYQASAHTFQPIQPIEENSEYAVRFEISGEGLTQLLDALTTRPK